jgi:hypothetical protein
MTRLMTILLLAVQVTLAGCASLNGGNSTVLRRYASHTRVTDSLPNVKITVFALPVPAAAAAETGITSLASDAQAEMVRMMASRTLDGGPQGLVQALAMPIRSAGSTPTFRDLTRFSRRLVFSLDNQSPGPANRISEARIYVRPVNGARFVSWNRIENDYQTVELGKLNLTQERSASAELGLTLPVLSAAPTLSASAGSALQEEMMLRQRRTALTGAITPGEAMLLQQGGLGIDLTGNITADFDLVVPHGGDTTVFVAALAASCDERPSFPRQTIRYPAPELQGPDTVPYNIWLSADLRYVLRDVRQGGETMAEGDDHVVFREGTTRVDSVVAIPWEMLRIAVYELRMGDTTVFIQGATQSGTSDRIAPLQFARFEDAAATLAWMRRCEMPKVGFPIFVAGRRLTGDEAEDMTIWRVPLNYSGPVEDPRIAPHVAPRG